MSEPAAAAGEKPKKSKKLLIIILALVVVLLAGAAAAWFLLINRHNPDEEGDVGTEQKQETKKKREGPPSFMALEAVVVNLADQGSTRYAQVGISLQLENDKTGEEIKKYMPAIRNGILMQISRRTADQLLSAEGKEQLATDILELVRSTTGMEESRGYSPVEAVLFSSLIVQ